MGAKHQRRHAALFWPAQDPRAHRTSASRRGIVRPGSQVLLPLPELSKTVQSSLSPATVRPYLGLPEMLGPRVREPEPISAAAAGGAEGATTQRKEAGAAQETVTERATWLMMKRCAARDDD